VHDRVFADRHALTNQGRIHVVGNVHGRARPEHQFGADANEVAISADDAAFAQPRVGAERHAADDCGTALETARRSRQ
jgi:hypothetical protein